VGAGRLLPPSESFSDGRCFRRDFFIFLFLIYIYIFNEGGGGFFKEECYNILWCSSSVLLE
jgi:hypothetical protein